MADLVDSRQVIVEVAISKTTGRLLLYVTSAERGDEFWAEGMKELVVDLGREDLLVFRPDGSTERRKRDS